MKIFLDPRNLRPAITRMVPVWEELGHSVIDDPNKCDVQLSSATISVDIFGRKPIVLRLDGVYYNKGQNYQKANENIKRSFERADAVVYQSMTSKIFCESYIGTKNVPYDIIHNGIDPEFWEKPIGKFKYEGFNIVSCANWRRWKRLPEIIEVFEKFREDWDDAQLHIIGEMRQGAKEIHKPGIIYHGKTTHEEMREIYKTADCFIHLSKNDSCPSTVVEAIGAKIPVITTDVCGGATEMAFLSNGCIVCEEGEMRTDPVYIYEDEWNTLDPRVRDNLVKGIEFFRLNMTRATLPAQLHIRTVAEKYLEIMKKIV